MPVTLTLHLADEGATLDAGAKLARALEPGIVVHLVGELGAGKTTLVRGLLAALGHRGKVKSPTYTLAELYELPGFAVCHFDFYRFTDPREWESAGFRDYFGGHAVCLVEWPDKARDAAPAPDLRLTLAVANGGRDLTIEPVTDRGERCAGRLHTSQRSS
jgi:tRNA threonylcarbamoyladenosine biosynthesis protein TsaE